jgi:surface polysaccharide O-acyltransferase-like enzyme
MFTCIEGKEAPAVVSDMSKLSYGMYLMHIFWLGLWVTLFKHTLALPTVAAIPAIAVATFISCYITSKLISYIPGSKWIIGA